MTFEELKAEADRQGYALIKRSPYVKLIPCICGHNKRSRWYGYDTVHFECKQCGRKSPPGRTDKDAIALWNAMIINLNADKEANND